MIDVELWNAFFRIGSELRQKGLEFSINPDPTMAAEGGNPLFVPARMETVYPAYRIDLYDGDRCMGVTYGRFIYSMGEDDYARYLVGLDSSNRIECRYPKIPIGPLGYFAGHWVDPEYRKQRLGYPFMLLSGLFGMLTYKVESYFAHVRSVESAKKAFSYLGESDHSATLYRDDEKVTDLYTTVLTREMIMEYHLAQTKKS